MIRIFKNIFYFTFVIWTLGGTPQHALACKCAGSSAQLDYKRADVVLIGELKSKVDLTKLNDKPLSTPVRFKVSDVLKGKTGDVSDLQIKRAQDVPAQCQAFTAESDGTYLLFLSGSAGKVGFTLLSDCYASQYPVDKESMVILDRAKYDKKTKLENLKSVLSAE